MPSASPGTATLHRMVMTKHMCPYGLKSLDLLKRQGFRVEDHHLTTRGEVDAFKEQHDVQTTPQTFIGASGSAAMTTCGVISATPFATRPRRPIGQ